MSNKEKIIQDLSILNSNLSLNEDRKGYVSIINNPPRLARFAIGAYEYAYLLKFEKNIDLNTIFVALIPEDSRTLRESTLTVLRSINLYFCLVLGDFSWQFTAPLEKRAGFFYTKKSLISYALKRDLPLEKTWSCFQSRLHCGKCFNCSTRREVFQKVGFVDKTKYEIYQRPLFCLIKSKLKIKLRLYSVIKGIMQYLPKEEKSKKPLARLDLSKSFAISSDIIWSEIDGNVNILNKTSGDYEMLNSCASLLWRSLATKPKTYSQLVEIIERSYQISKKRITDDLTKFLRICLREKLLIQT